MEVKGFLWTCFSKTFGLPHKEETWDEPDLLCASLSVQDGGPDTTRQILLSIYFFVLALFLTVLTPIPSWAVCNLSTLNPGEWCDTGASLGASGVEQACTSPCYGMTSGIKAFSGGAYDSKRQELLIFGGGHGDGNGNEVFAFSLNTLTWRRVIDRSLNQYLNPPRGPDGVEALGDGKPNSRHTYDGLVYLPIQDKLFVSHGSLASGSGGGSKGTWELDLTAPAWMRMKDAPSTSVANWSAYNPLTGKIIAGGDNSNIVQFDSVAGTWSTLKDMSGIAISDGEFSAVIDDQRKLFIMIGNGYLYSYGIKAKTLRAITSTGPQNVVNARGPGVVFDPNIKKIIAWTGLDADRRTVYTLDTRTWAWTSSTGTGDVPSPPVSRYSRTYGRWQYSPEKNVYVLMNDTNANIYLYRPYYTNPVRPNE